MRRLNNGSTYKVQTKRGVYAVVLERLKNGNYGQPRFKAHVITLEVFGDTIPTNYLFTRVYTFTGHYMNDEGEAEWIVARVEEEIGNKED